MTQHSSHLLPPPKSESVPGDQAEGFSHKHAQIEGLFTKISRSRETEELCISPSLLCNNVASLRHVWPLPVSAGPGRHLAERVPLLRGQEAVWGRWSKLRAPLGLGWREPLPRPLGLLAEGRLCSWGHRSPRHTEFPSRAPASWHVCSSHLLGQRKRRRGCSLWALQRAAVSCPWLCPPVVSDPELRPPAAPALKKPTSASEAPGGHRCLRTELQCLLQPLHHQDQHGILNR